MQEEKCFSTAQNRSLSSEISPAIICGDKRTYEFVEKVSNGLTPQPLSLKLK